MKHGKKLTRKQKEFLASKRLNPINWLVERNTNDKLVVVHKQTGTVKMFSV